MHEKTIIDESLVLIKQIQDQQVDRQRPVLMVMDGENIKARHTIDQTEMVVGRDMTCDIVLGDTKSSRRHARLTYQNLDTPAAPPRIILRDLNSTNGVFVNGQKISEVELKDRDKIIIGTSEIKFCLRDESTLRAEQRLIELATTDALTTLRNRAVFDLEIQREWDRARRYERHLSLVMLDVDYFKHFNDTYGHQTGDQVLRDMGALIARNSRLSDISCRYGGEEIAIILPETSMERALIQAERIRSSVAAQSFGSAENPLKVTVSVGVAASRSSMEQAEDLIRAADEALYRAKQAGRNQVCWQGTTDQFNLGPDQTAGGSDKES